MANILRTRQLLRSYQQKCYSTSVVAAAAARRKISPDTRANLIFGANTDVGKTVVSAGLVQASLENTNVTYLKPLQCGHSDQAFVEKYISSSKHANNLTVQTLFDWKTPASPHVASRLENKPVSDAQVHDAIEQALAQQAPGSTMYVETAGGVLSPSAASPENATATADAWGWQTQADLYKSFSLPVVLVGDGRLGGISATLAALEVLVMRGYDIAALVLLEQDEYGMDNIGALREYCERGLRTGNGEELLAVPSQSIVSLPPIPKDPTVPLFDWYAQVQDRFQRLDAFLQQTHRGQVSDWQSLSEEAESVLWWPSTESKNTRLVDSATGDFLNVLRADGSDVPMESCSVLDACDETKGLGHGNSSLTLASTASMGRYGNLWYPGTAHAPAVTLAQQLAQISGADRVLFSQDPPVELALYMGLKTYHTRQNVENPQDYDWAVCAQEGCYHGDTLGALNVGEPLTTYLEDQHPWYAPKSLLPEPPTLGFKDGILSIAFPEVFDPKDDGEYAFDSIQDAMDVTGRLLSNRKLHSVYKERIEMQWLVYEHSGLQRKIASLILEPLWSRDKFIDPLWQRALVDVAKSRNVPVIFDEVRSGLYRTGVPSCREILRVDPDITCFGNHLTGGSVPLNAVSVKQEIVDAFDADEGFLCGHTHAAHPAGCVSAIQTLDSFSSLAPSKKGRLTKPAIHMVFSEEKTKELSALDLVEECFTLGSILTVKIREEEDADHDSDICNKTAMVLEKLWENGVLACSHENTIQLVLSPMAAPHVGAKATAALGKAIQAVEDDKPDLR